MSWAKANKLMPQERKKKMETAAAAAAAFSRGDRGKRARTLAGKACGGGQGVEASGPAATA